MNENKIRSYTQRPANPHIKKKDPTSPVDRASATQKKNKKSEPVDLLWLYNQKIGLRGIIDAYEARRTAPEDIADFLGITPEFLIDAIRFYRSNYGPFIYLDNYVVFFEPELAVGKRIR